MARQTAVYFDCMIHFFDLFMGVPEEASSTEEMTTRITRSLRLVLLHVCDKM